MFEDGGVIMYEDDEFVPSQEKMNLTEIIDSNYSELPKAKEHKAYQEFKNGISKTITDRTDYYGEKNFETSDSNAQATFNGVHARNDSKDTN